MASRSLCTFHWVGLVSEWAPDVVQLRNIPFGAQEVFLLSRIRFRIANNVTMLIVSGVLSRERLHDPHFLAELDHDAPIQRLELVTDLHSIRVPRSAMNLFAESRVESDGIIRNIVSTWTLQTCTWTLQTCTWTLQTCT